MLGGPGIPWVPLRAGGCCGCLGSWVSMGIPWSWGVPVGCWVQDLLQGHRSLGVPEDCVVLRSPGCHRPPAAGPVGDHAPPPQQHPQLLSQHPWGTSAPQQRPSFLPKGPAATLTSHTPGMLPSPLGDASPPCVPLPPPGLLQSSCRGETPMPTPGSQGREGSVYIFFFSIFFPFYILLFQTM